MISMRRSALFARRARYDFGRRGTAMVEFALVLPMLLLLLVGVLDLGFAIYDTLQVQAAATAGAQYAARNTWDSGAISAEVAGATGTPGITATPVPTQVCGCTDGGQFSVVGCATRCPSGTAPGLYASVSAQLQYQPTLPYPGLPSPLTLTGQAYQRLQ